MTKTELVQQEMFAAMKNKDTERKAALSMLLSTLTDETIFALSIVSI